MHIIHLIQSTLSGETPVSTVAIELLVHIWSSLR